MSQDLHSKSESSPHGPGNPGSHSDLEDYAGGYIQAHHGTIPAWLMLVYLILFVFALFYMVFYWGGLGPGLGY